MLGLAAPKKVLPEGLNSMQLDRLGARVSSPHRFHPNAHAPPKDPVFSTTGSSVPTLVNTLSYHHLSPQSSSFSLLTLLDHIIELQVLLWFHEALDLPLLLYPTPT